MLQTKCFWVCLCVCEPFPQGSETSLVDMLSYALDNQAPATAILISGDRNFAYAVSVLRHRRYRVILIAPATVHSSLKSQASSVLDWNVDVLDKCVPGILDFGSGSFPPSSHALSDKKNAQSAHFPPPNLPQPGPKMPHQRPAIALVTSTRRRGVSLSQCLEGGLSPIELKGPKAPWVRAGSGSSDLPGPTRTSAGDASQLTDRSTKMDVLPQTLPFFKTGYHTEFVDRSKPQWPSGEMSNHGFAHEFATTGPISESSNKSVRTSFVIRLLKQSNIAFSALRRLPRLQCIDRIRSRGRILVRPCQRLVILWRSEPLASGPRSLRSLQHHLCNLA
jgi:hypothetical protein